MIEPDGFSDCFRDHGMLGSASVDGRFIDDFLAIYTQFFFLNSLAFPGCQQTQLAFFLLFFLS